MKPLSSLTSHRCGPLLGRVRVPGDKSISHRALMLGAVALGETRISGLLEGEDVLCTAAAMRAMGAQVERLSEGEWVVNGLGVGGLLQPHSALDMGNSGTAARLLMGLVAGQGLKATFVGDASLSSRPMNRVIDPLSQVGAVFEASEGGRMPLTITGAQDPMPITYELPMASAQVKSAVLLAGLNAPGQTVVIEPKPTRDHSEKMLTHFGAKVEVEELDGGARRITLHGRPELRGRDVIVPADISSAAFVLVGAAIVEGSDITVTHVGLNPLRAGVVETLKDFGADIKIIDQRIEAGEIVGDVRIRYQALKGCTVPASRAPAQIDEYPVLFAAAACAEGESRFEGLEELRVKESDRLSVMVEGLTACGVEVEEGDDWLVVKGVGGTGQRVPGGAEVASHLDHRIAMSFLVLGMAAQYPIKVDDVGPIDTSFPGFQVLMESLGATLVEE
ncbi:3-phosphoshikimate 1-carboxyvinyltransferase [Magnetovibrio blakemorei]|uniref:3-phosphoshikimate 1-carboxyvinyltransferase n=1 Tax=Magnetovibrio blakemorei TaxID=28181 RepID=A0A1E5QBL9_9PROT|nr:3-phosphoshikimate 1-carboxyvinyltransferase [Magnetovibrio blakemorei]